MASLILWSRIMSGSDDTKVDEGAKPINMLGEFLQEIYRCSHEDVSASYNCLVMEAATSENYRLAKVFYEKFSFLLPQNFTLELKYEGSNANESHRILGMGDIDGAYKSNMGDLASWTRDKVAMVDELDNRSIKILARWYAFGGIFDVSLMSPSRFEHVVSRVLVEDVEREAKRLAVEAETAKSKEGLKVYKERFINDFLCPKREKNTSQAQLKKDLESFKSNKGNRKQGSNKVHLIELMKAFYALDNISAEIDRQLSNLGAAKKSQINAILERAYFVRGQLLEDIRAELVVADGIRAEGQRRHYIVGILASQIGPCALLKNLSEVTDLVVKEKLGDCYELQYASPLARENAQARKEELSEKVNAFHAKAERYYKGISLVTAESRGGKTLSGITIFAVCVLAAIGGFIGGALATCYLGHGAIFGGAVGAAKAVTAAKAALAAKGLMHGGIKVAASKIAAAGAGKTGTACAGAVGAVGGAAPCYFGLKHVFFGQPKRMNRPEQFTSAAQASLN